MGARAKQTTALARVRARKRSSEFPDHTAELLRRMFRRSSYKGMLEAFEEDNDEKEEIEGHSECSLALMPGIECARSRDGLARGSHPSHC